jgi:integrase
MFHGGTGNYYDVITGSPFCKGPSYHINVTMRNDNFIMESICVLHQVTKQNNRKNMEALWCMVMFIWHLHYFSAAKDALPMKSKMQRLVNRRLTLHRVSLPRVNRGKPRKDTSLTWADFKKRLANLRCEANYRCVSLCIKRMLMWNLAFHGGLRIHTLIWLGEFLILSAVFYSPIVAAVD